ncbi:YbhB/YbcL family Raf kinase inhibitor-like protein [Nitrincola iocasae]|uniref:YbhB/YbcL family Raf kinase inhibitor-like protein n=1 Tax=Nitrincola iocasae TaxID=2614693 RepID=A0A5J6LB36_9GAMM|nr:YbhB/YbcL family Raf kinase inhibitor-like protein [Nitrincola iocasae]QEW05561.1 YbhB/YbcL family Raf kinase inhibitor-like protein [Nitrincola iocasae]
MAFALSSIQLTSNAFPAGGQIPSKHTGEGDNISPALAWDSVPEGTQAFALICHDPDAPLIKQGSYGFVHWVLYNLPADLRSLVEGSTEGTSGVNDYGKNGYAGPMPPEGHGLHHYYFWILALERPLQLPAGLSMAELLEKTEPYLLGVNRLVGTYQRD